MRKKINYKKTIILILLINLFTTLIFKDSIYSQVPTIFAEYPIISKSGIYNSQKMDSLITPYVNNDSLINNEKNNNCETFKFGYAIDVDYELTSGSFDKTKNNCKVWKLKIISEDAYSINLIFDKFYLPEGAALYIYNEERTMVYGPVTSINCNISTMFASDVIKGESIILEYFEPYISLKKGEIHISKIIHGYKDIFKINLNTKGYEESGDCEINIKCPEGDDWCVESRAVAMILKNDNTEWCSGSMINNVKQNFIPFFLTANHCLGNNFNPNTALFRFHYKNPDCNSNIYYGIYWTYTGSIFRANSNVSDFALLELNNYNVNNNINKLTGIHFAGWSIKTADSGPVTCIHHPAGDVMKISKDNEQPHITDYDGYSNTHWYVVNWDKGSTTGGSSGSPLFNSDHKIIGQDHSGNGYSECNKDKGTYFGAFYKSFDLGLKEWLDPENTGIIEVKAISPPIIYHNKTISGGPYLYTATHEMELAGNVSGYPTMPHNFPPNLWPYPENNQPFIVEPGSNVEFKAGKRIVIKPGTYIKQGAKSRGYIAPVTCSDGLDYHRSLIETNNNENDISLDKISENDVLPYDYTKLGNVKSIISNHVMNFTIYPNPFTNSTTITFNLQQSSKVNIFITNIYGIKISEVYNNFMEAGSYNITLDGSDLQPGMYFFIMETETSREMIKIVKM